MVEEVFRLNISKVYLPSAKSREWVDRLSVSHDPCSKTGVRRSMSRQNNFNTWTRRLACEPYNMFTRGLRLGLKWRPWMRSISAWSAQSTRYLLLIR